MVGEARLAGCLYRAVLGSAFNDLPPVLRRFHGLPGGGTAEGVLRVERGHHWISRRVGDALRFPPAGEGLPVRLETRPVGSREVWRRSFGGRVMKTAQWCHRAFLVEAVGPVMFGLHVTGDATGMQMLTARCWVLGVPLPAWLSPRVTATVVGREAGWHVAVAVRAPVLGLLLRYEGEVVPRW